ncbi:heparinase II/III family protein [Tianweitania populi]|uniref:Heparinase II/III family protein n=1 Tax=Tianweitania populi TaxID=1607949 RepID=A0A8J3GKM3_9HYPH|nr:heparinase II/III family protein [Tianweitania populi]GHD17822.1 heparinase II/III family protein [Tianweitania populi]
MSAAVEAPELWGLVAKALWRKTRRRLRAGPGWRFRYAGRTPDRLLIAPPDLRLADPQIAQDIYYGRFPFAGKVVETSGRSPFDIKVASPEWVEALQNFHWLRHLRAAQTELAAVNARALVGEWIGLHGKRISHPAWDAGITASRVISWLQHSSIILQGADFAFYRQFLKALSVQVRYLRAVAAEMPVGEDRLRARIALAFAALSLPVPAATLRTATRCLAEELDRQILPDGGHISRSPLAVLELLADLLPLRQTYANQSATPPQALMGAVDRMLPALRFFRHQDGSLARFNGMGVTVHDRVAAILRHDDACAAPLLHAPHSGYERLSMGGTTVIADTGPAPAVDQSAQAHAGCLSFELSSSRRSFIVNAGVDTFGARDFRPLARATAAHSTAVFNDASSARFNLAGMNGWIGTPLVAGPRVVRSRRLDEGRNGSTLQGFIASHDGYLQRFGLFHERQLVLSDGGQMLEGIDRFHAAGNGLPRSGHVAIRFHVHPDAELDRDGDSLVIQGRDGEGWIFRCGEVLPEIEDSIFFAGLAGPARTKQIVLHYDAAEHPTLAWRFTRITS